MDPFLIKDCALAGISTGLRAETLKELKERLEVVPISCIYYHFWGDRLRPHFSHTEYHNDFARWAYGSLHDQTLAERLSVIDPTEYTFLEDLRQYVAEHIEIRMEELGIQESKRADKAFYFIHAKNIIFNTPYSIQQPEELVRVIPLLTPSSIYYHFIDARRRTTEYCDDFSLWLKGIGKGNEKLIHDLSSIDPYFLTLVELKEAVYQTVIKFFKGKS